VGQGVPGLSGFGLALGIIECESAGWADRFDEAEIPATMMLDERKAAVLRAVVEAYISTAQPVGSGHVADAPGVNVSSATVRNDMVLLEQEGYLQQPHTSAGRVPTEKGYRFFVDSLVGPNQLGTVEAQRVRSFFSTAHGELERMLHDTSQLLSGLTSYAAVVVGPPHEVALIRSIQLVPLAERVVLIVVVLSNGAIEKHTMELGDDLDDEVIDAASRTLTSQLLGRTVHAFSEVSGAALGPATPAAAVVDAVRDAFVASHAESDGESVYIGGASQMASAFDAVATVSEVLRILEQQYLVVSLLQDVLDRGLSVAIGTETGIEPLTECSVVVAPYRVDGETAGSIGVLGPTRMNYPQAMAAVALVSQRLGRRLSEG
jgi:heat-inducible transcriptional repressor